MAFEFKAHHNPIALKTKIKRKSQKQAERKTHYGKESKGKNDFCLAVCKNETWNNQGIVA